MKIIIIGSKGFIGSNVLKYFSLKGHEVWGADVVTDYVNTEKYFLIDVSNSDFLSVFQKNSYDLCINCSGAASVHDSLVNAMRDFYLNTVNVFKILEAIKNYQPSCRFINLSSAAVYGNPEQLPVEENSNTLPLSPYGFHKLQSEQICKEFHAFYNLKVCSLRIFSVYGNGLQKQLFWDLFKKAKTGLPFTLYGTGRESRDFIHITDLVSAIDLVSKHSTFEADVLNVANGKEVFIKDAVSIFFSFFNSEIPYSFSGDVREGDPINWKADIRKLMSFGYNQSVDISAGLQMYYQWLTTDNTDLT